MTTTSNKQSKAISGKIIKHYLGLTFTHLIIIFFAVIMVYPVIWLVMKSFTPNNEIFSNVTSVIPTNFTFENYVAGFSPRGGLFKPFVYFVGNSLGLSIVIVILNVASCSMAAYAFARINFKLRGLWFSIVLLTLMLPYHVVTIPRYILFSNMGLINMRDVAGMNLNFLYLPLTLPKLFATDAFFIFLLVQFMRSIPKDLDESAILDGCGKVGIFFRIIIPLSVAALVTTALFSFLWSWDDYFNQLLYVHDTARYTVPIVLRTFISSDSVSDWGASLAMSVISIIPCFILFFSLQKYFVQGIATTGIKG